MTRFAALFDHETAGPFGLAVFLCLHIVCAHDIITKSRPLKIIEDQLYVFIRKKYFSFITKN